MSELAEVEAIVAKMPRATREQLLERLSASLRRISDQRPLADWPVPPPNVPLEELNRIDRGIEQEFSRLDGRP